MPSKKRSRVEYGFMDCRHLRRRRCRESCTILLGFANLPEEEIRAGGSASSRKIIGMTKKGEAYCGSLLLSIGKRQMIKEKGKRENRDGSKEENEERDFSYRI